MPKRIDRLSCIIKTLSMVGESVLLFICLDFVKCVLSLQAPPPLPPPAYSPSEDPPGHDDRDQPEVLGNEGPRRSARIQRKRSIS